MCRRMLGVSARRPRGEREMLRARLTERVCYGMELDPKYVDVVVSRWQALSGEEAHLDGDGRSFDEIAAERHQETEAMPSGEVSV